MPSGDVWLLAVTGDLTSLRGCAEAICDAWPDAVIEDTLAGEFAHSVGALAPNDESELCVYRDLEVTRLWQQGGRPDEMWNSMVQVSLDSRGVRLIADDWEDPALGEVVRHLCSWQATWRCGSGELRSTPAPTCE